MTPERKQKWIAALRSGKYEQGSGAFYTELEGTSKFCCLGVLADIVDPDRWQELPSSSGTRCFGWDTSSTVFTNEQLRELGLTDTEQSCLVNLNDEPEEQGRGHKHSFRTIADWIQTHILEATEA